METYQIRDKDGNIIAEETTNANTDFEQHFFEKYLYHNCLFSFE